MCLAASCSTLKSVPGVHLRQEIFILQLPCCTNKTSLSYGRECGIALQYMKHQPHAGIPARQGETAMPMGICSFRPTCTMFPTSITPFFPFSSCNEFPFSLFLTDCWSRVTRVTLFSSSMANPSVPTAASSALAAPTLQRCLRPNGRGKT